jgi:hypothetical protein
LLFVRVKQGSLSFFDAYLFYRRKLARGPARCIGKPTAGRTTGYISQTRHVHYGESNEETAN